MMNATISMEGFWKMREEEILSGIKRSLNEAKSGQIIPLDKIWDQL